MAGEWGSKETSFALSHQVVAKMIRAPNRSKNIPLKDNSGTSLWLRGGQYISSEH